MNGFLDLPTLAGRDSFCRLPHSTCPSRAAASASAAPRVAAGGRDGAARCSGGGLASGRVPGRSCPGEHADQPHPPRLDPGWPGPRWRGDCPDRGLRADSVRGGSRRVAAAGGAGCPCRRVLRAVSLGPLGSGRLGLVARRGTVPPGRSRHRGPGFPAARHTLAGVVARSVSVLLRAPRRRLAGDTGRCGARTSRHCAACSAGIARGARRLSSSQRRPAGPAGQSAHPRRRGTARGARGGLAGGRGVHAAVWLDELAVVRQPDAPARRLGDVRRAPLEPAARERVSQLARQWSPVFG